MTLNFPQNTHSIIAFLHHLNSELFLSMKNLVLKPYTAFLLIMHMFLRLLCVTVVWYWLIAQYLSGFLHWQYVKHLIHHMKLYAQVFLKRMNQNTYFFLTRLFKISDVTAYWRFGSTSGSCSSRHSIHWSSTLCAVLLITGVSAVMLLTTPSGILHIVSWPLDQNMNHIVRQPYPYTPIEAEP